MPGRDFDSQRLSGSDILTPAIEMPNFSSPLLQKKLMSVWTSSHWMRYRWKASKQLVVLPVRKARERGNQARRGVTPRYNEDIA